MHEDARFGPPRGAGKPRTTSPFSLCMTFCRISMHILCIHLTYYIVSGSHSSNTTNHHDALSICFFDLTSRIPEDRGIHCGFSAKLAYADGCLFVRGGCDAMEKLMYSLGAFRVSSRTKSPLFYNFTRYATFDLLNLHSLSLMQDFVTGSVVKAWKYLFNYDSLHSLAFTLLAKKACL